AEAGSTAEAECRMAAPVSPVALDFPDARAVFPEAAVSPAAAAFLAAGISADSATVMATAAVMVTTVATVTGAIAMGTATTDLDIRTRTGATVGHTRGGWITGIRSSGAIRMRPITPTRTHPPTRSLTMI